MRLPLKAVAFLLLIICSQHAVAQTRQEVFAALQQIVNRAVGEKIDGNSLFSKEPDKITKQLFTETAVAVYTKNMEKKSTEWIHRYSNISWNDIFDHDVFTEYKNSDLQIVKVRFKKSFKSEFFPSDEAADDDPSSSDYFEFYIRTKDKAEFEKNMNLLYSFKPKKQESAFNAQIRKFTKDQTISWLQTKLNENLYAGQYGSNIKISINSCQLTVTYRGLVRSYEEILPTAILAINKYGKFEYSTNAASIRTTTPDSFDDGKKTFGKYSGAVAISDRNEEIMENIACALKHLSGFCNGTNNSSTATAVPGNGSTTLNQSGINNSSTGVTTNKPPVSVSGESGAQKNNNSSITTARWYVHFSRGKDLGMQAWNSSLDFPSAAIDSRWKSDYYITDITYGGADRKWFVTFSKNTNYTDQIWRLADSREKIMTAIKDIWRKDTSHKITTLSYINNQWIAVTSKGSNYKSQVFFHADEFPETKIEAYWKQNYDITDMAYSPTEGWIVVMSLGGNYTQRYRKFALEDGWNHSRILEDEKSKFYISSVAKTKTHWYVLLQTDSKLTSSAYNYGEAINVSEINPKWDAGYNIDKVFYIPGKND
ncbi:hypothetical protein ESA94_02710 [Lacibacter luteus]|uniref:DUF7477 domain-containing protein n=1 Tax=Lacibacter luteus TaxID=2508719 RepID=A0A4Q1CMM2_9BACT|nr:hypothetical protein [Lacibacter luteus]RXK61941.1 hypothetical protein ESA94_02710 [Lacibacter luteus]